MNARTVHRKLLRARRLVRAFTLVEMLICVGAVALIAVGLGKLFASTGDTVRIGRRLSYLNEMAATLESRIRQDLAAATRDGPMIIRHKLADAGGAGILLSPDDRNPAPKGRRIDEIVFLANGHFTTNREPQWPGRSPSSSVARISIGHGMVRSADDALVTPNLTDDPENTTNTATRWPTDFGASGPNQYAGNWILLRHVTVLARPQTTSTQAGSIPARINGQEVPSYLTQANWQDSFSQIDLQPAAPTVFRFDPKNLNEPDRLGYGYEKRDYRSLTAVQPQQLPVPQASQWFRNGDTVVGFPQFAGGLVDIATVDPAMIRSRILSVPQRLPFDSSFNTQVPAKMTLMAATQAAFESTTYDTQNPAHLQKMLMASMLPGADPWIYQRGSLATPITPLTSLPSGPIQELRTICAAKPANFSGTRSAGGIGWSTDQPYRQQDQAMLSASNLIVGCSSFKIEWSFGDVYPEFDEPTPPAVPVRYTAAAPRIGQLIWHGRPQSTRENPPIPGEMQTQPYRGSVLHGPLLTDRYDAFHQRWTRTNGQSVSRVFPGRLVHWPVSQLNSGAAALADDVPFYSFFGYLDPTYNPIPAPGATQVDPDTLEWPWPKLLRFTIGLTDPIDPTFEQTYQFVVEVPAASQRQ